MTSEFAWDFHATLYSKYGKEQWAYFHNVSESTYQTVEFFLFLTKLVNIGNLCDTGMHREEQNKLCAESYPSRDRSMDL